MKNKFTIFMSGLMVALLLMLGATTAFAALSPNHGYIKQLDTITYYAYVQCQPSYVENGKHAARGQMNFYAYNANTKRYDFQIRFSTPYGDGPNDSRVLKRSVDYYSSRKIKFNCNFHWITDGSRRWIVNESPVTE